MKATILRFLILLWSIFSLSCINAQKEVYVPAYLKDINTVDGSQFSWSKTAQSENFVLFWGNDAGLNPVNAPDPDLRFNPVAVLDTMEWIYEQFHEMDFIRDGAGTNMGKYKVPVIMLNTFGPDGATGWAFGGDVDGVIGAFWAHPLSMNGGHVAAHEFAHSMQAQVNIDHRMTNGLGYVWLNAGIFWETHANFMRNLLYPQDVSAWGMDMYHVETWGDWKNTYENYALLMAIMEMDGIGIINRMWRESYSKEYPLQTYKRLMGFDQEQFNDHLYNYARRMAGYDFSHNNVGEYFRQYRKNDLRYWLPSVQATWTILQQNAEDPNHYFVPVHLAPEEYAYNVIPIYPEEDSCAVIVKFRGHTETNAHAGWRYGFVATSQDGKVSRYGETYSRNEAEIAFELLPAETALYLVVMGAPIGDITTNTENDTWHGYPKHFRFPYELYISGGRPEGFQDPEEFRSQLKFDGHLHPNGGGWVQNSASVSSSVYLGPHTLVLGNAHLSGDVRVENTAMVRDAVVSGQVIIRDNAYVQGGQLSDQVIIEGQSFAENNTMWGQAKLNMRARVSNYRLHGNIEVGGDVIVYNATGNCDNGVYYRMTNYYDDKLLECDGRTAGHPDNRDVNQAVEPFSPEQMQPFCHCAIYPECLLVSDGNTDEPDLSMLFYPVPASESLKLKQAIHGQKPMKVDLYDMFGNLVLSKKISDPETFRMEVGGLANGVYSGVVFTETKAIYRQKVVIFR
ncbi:MAG TPA: hypothetical protein DCX89_07125 [Saprospirales bacterium]|nr:hypothetical protein [Saprospirales bacterium]HAY71647.1 hypothetical protein [Saprospirales bacterium]HRQ29200.1 DUF6055 domain-containing protein [Saprospiraceae bacterium]